MSLSRHRTEIETELMSEMELIHPGFVLIGENSRSIPISDTSWIRMSLTILDITYPCIGKDTERTDGLFNVQVHTPLAAGAGEASTLVDEVRTILKASTLTGIEFLSFDVATGSQESDWYVLLLRATYRATD